MTAKVYTIDNAVVYKPDGDLRVHAITGLRAEFEKLASANPRVVAIDLEQVRFIDSSGLGLLVHLAKRLRGEGGCLCLFNYNDDVKELLDIAGFGEIIPLYDSFEAFRDSLDSYSEQR